MQQTLAQEQAGNSARVSELQVYVCTCVYLYVSMYVVRMYLCMLCVCIYTYSAYVYLPARQAILCVFPNCRCMYVCMHVCMYVRCVYVCMHRARICISTCKAGLVRVFPICRCIHDRSVKCV